MLPVILTFNLHKKNKKTRDFLENDDDAMRNSRKTYYMIIKYSNDPKITFSLRDSGLIFFFFFFKEEI